MKELGILGCPLNLSEGRRSEVVDEVTAAAGACATVLDVSSDPDHNRTVITLAGNARQVVGGVLAAASRAVDLIDLREHLGVHPRMGSVDVIPFTPYCNASMADAVVAARACGTRLWEELEVPCFFYEAASPDAEVTTLPWVRRHAFKELAPSFGGPGPHPTAGASAVGARDALVAFNVNLDSSDKRVATLIASALRGGSLGEKGVRALGLLLPSRGRIQVSMNLTKPDLTPARQVLATVEDLASSYGVSIVDTEFVGLVPEVCIGRSGSAPLKVREKPKILETMLDEICSGPRLEPRL
jgi:glutamate formiminotransferase